MFHRKITLNGTALNQVSVVALFKPTLVAIATEGHQTVALAGGGVVDLAVALGALQLEQLLARHDGDALAGGRDRQGGRAGPPPWPRGGGTASCWR